MWFVEEENVRENDNGQIWAHAKNVSTAARSLKPAGIGWLGCVSGASR